MLHRFLFPGRACIQTNNRDNTQPQACRLKSRASPCRSDVEVLRHRIFIFAARPSSLKPQACRLTLDSRWGIPTEPLQKIANSKQKTDYDTSGVLVYPNTQFLFSQRTTPSAENTAPAATLVHPPQESLPTHPHHPRRQTHLTEHSSDFQSQHHWQV